jgi:hypothetical protein
MCGAIPPLPNTPSWRGVQLKSTVVILPIIIIIIIIIIITISHNPSAWSLRHNQ